MKRILVVMLTALCGFVACKKDRHSKSDYPFVYLNQCINQKNDSDRLQLCFDEVVSDSRCPENMVCVAEGTAVAKFTFRIDGGQAHPLTLSTQRLNVPFGNDTIVENYRITFLDLKPIPATGSNAPHVSKIYAKMKISAP